MTAAVVALATAVVVLSVAVMGLLRGQALERTQWATERRSLVDRVIARHAGEAIALDRTPRGVTPPAHSNVERPVAVGL